MTTFELNGHSVSVDSPDATPLLWIIRDELGLTGTKFGCGIGFCGACTVHVEGRATRIVHHPAWRGCSREDHTDRRDSMPTLNIRCKQHGFELQVPQCGYCQSGQIMQAATLLEALSPTRH